MTPIAKSVLRSVSACAAVLCLSSPLRAQTVLTFEGLLDGESIDRFYEGGLGSMGSGPGPALGVTITGSMARTGVVGTLAGDALPSTRVLLNAITTINVDNGFRTGFAFLYANPGATTEVRLFAGPNLTGQLLGIWLFGASPLGLDLNPLGLDNPLIRAGLKFSGTARSVGLVSRGPAGVWIDNLTLGSNVAGTAGMLTRYTLTDLGRITDNFSRGSGPRVNEAGQMFVQNRLADRRADRVVFWEPGAAGEVELGTLGGSSTFGAAINALGQIVGWSARADMTPHAFLWSATAGLQDLGTLGGPSSAALGVNDSGQVVGMSSPAAGADAAHGFLWQDGGMTDLNDLTIANRQGWTNLERAYSVSNTGVIVGSGLMQIDETTERHYFALVPIAN